MHDGLSCLQICLASVLNLRSPDDSGLAGTAADKLACMLFGPPPTPPPPGQPGDQIGVKTKTQLLAERQVLIKSAIQPWPGKHGGYVY